MVAKLYSETDDDLVRQCLNGKTQSFRRLYQRHHPKVRSLLYQLCGAEALDDLVQEVFLRAWRGLQQFRRSAQFSTWLYRITWNVACDQRRAFAKKRERHVAIEDSHLQNLPDERPQPLLQTLHYQDLIRQGLGHLSLDHRSVIILHDLEEVPQKEISQVLDIPIGTVKSRLFHARSALRTFLISQGVEL